MIKMITKTTNTTMTILNNVENGTIEKVVSEKDPKKLNESLKELTKSMGIKSPWGEGSFDDFMNGKGTLNFD